jgi:hypothetical protein
LEHLRHPGEQIPYAEDGSVQPIPKEGVPKEGVSKEGVSKEGVSKEGVSKEGVSKEGVSKDGLVQIAHWQPKRTHEVGKDESGNVRDFVAVWRHQ